MGERQIKREGGGVGVWGGLLSLEVLLRLLPSLNRCKFTPGAVCVCACVHEYDVCVGGVCACCVICKGF